MLFEKNTNFTNYKISEDRKTLCDFFSAQKNFSCFFETENAFTIALVRLSIRCELALE